MAQSQNLMQTFRIDPELHGMLSARAKRDRTTVSEAVRQALRRNLADEACS